MPLKDLDDDARAIKLGEVAQLELGAGPADVRGRSAADDAGRARGRIPATRSSWTRTGPPSGVLTLQAGAATLAGWPDDDSAWLLRGFLIDRRQQGKGLGTLAAAAAVREAAKLTARLGGGQAGVVLSVNELQPRPAKPPTCKAGFEDRAATWAARPARSGPCTGPSESRPVGQSPWQATPLRRPGSVPTLCLGSALQTLLGGRLETKSHSSRRHSPEQAGSRSEHAWSQLPARRQAEHTRAQAKSGRARKHRRAELLLIGAGVRRHAHCGGLPVRRHQKHPGKQHGVLTLCQQQEIDRIFVDNVDLQPYFWRRQEICLTRRGHSRIPGRQQEARQLARPGLKPRPTGYAGPLRAPEVPDGNAGLHLRTGQTGRAYHPAELRRHTAASCAARCDDAPGSLWRDRCQTPSGATLRWRSPAGARDRAGEPGQGTGAGERKRPRAATG